ncbi:SpoIIE family protein phosphatase [Streptomyces sp. NPDC101237]|uniref:SpoIIE family protein phosphatase n=1 Tax=Streptomyces sp. NPDC101237 TaxID=3366139 RepID=UPI0038083BD5
MRAVVWAAASGSAQNWADLAGLLRRLVGDTSASSAMVFLLAPGEPVLRLSMLYGTSWTVASPWARIHVEEAVPAAEATRDRRLVWVGSPETLALHYPRLALMVPEHTVAAAPLIAGDTVRGAVCLLWPPSHAVDLSPRETTAIDAYCQEAGRLLERAVRGGRPLVPAERPLIVDPDRACSPVPAEALAAHDFAARLPGALSLDLDGRITFVGDPAAALLGLPTGELTAGRPWERVPWLAGSAFEERFRAAVIGQRPVRFTAERTPGTRVFFQLFPGASGVSVHMTPLPRPAPTAGPRPVSREEDTDVRPYHQLMHLAAALTETVRVKDVAETIANQLLPSFGAAGLILMAASEGRLQVVGQRGYTTAFLAVFDGHSLGSDNPPAKALTGHTPLFFGSFAEFKRTYPDAVQYGRRNAWAFLPLVIRGRPVGILVLSFDRTRDFPSAERHLMVSLAGLVAQALDRACLHEAKDNLARTLQTGLLPQRLPEIPGLDAAARYLPARHGMDVGGDFYDLIRCGTTTATAVIGDVQGHNVRAAAVMGQLRTAVHTHAIAGMEPDDLLARTNEVMCDFDPGLFASCLCVQFDRARRRVLLATAGHLPPLLRLPDGRSEALALPPGPLLGIVPDADYPCVELPLTPGTTMALYTDGLVEVPGIDIGDAVTDLASRFARSPADDVEALTDGLLGDLSCAARADDIAVLLVHFTG